MNRARSTCAAMALLLIAPILITGCVSEATARARERAAFLAGQQQAAQQLQAQGPNVTVLGPVRNRLIPWTADLTLARAVVAADYYGAKDPTDITIIRDGKQMKIDPRRLLGGEDLPLQPRDIVALQGGP